MWIVQLALRRPYTFAVLALLIVLVGVGSILRMPKDIFPEIDIPVVTVIWSYTGTAPQDMERRFVTVTERAYTTSVGDIEHIESQSMNGVGVIRVYFQPGANVPQGIAQIAATSQSVLRTLPPGTTPPLIIRYDASDVPVLQASLNSQTLSEAELYDFGNNFIRTQLATVRGASVPLPYGGKSRQVVVDLDPQALYAKGLSPLDVSNAINAQNLILPTGDAKIGDRDYTILLNGSPQTVDALNNLPIKQVNGATVYIRDVANVRDGFAVQQNLVNQDGKRAALLTVLKSGAASTLDVVDRVKAALPGIKTTLPPELKINLLADQSVFVKAAIQGVVREAVLAACLTALMILLFLGSLRSTLIVAVSIPLSILTSVAVLGALGMTLNVMTLGGLALAVGILVDDTTVTIENINRYLAQGESLKRAILDGSAEIALPALVSTLSICIVFLPVFFLTGAAKSLFLPLALAVIFAMLASYLLSRTLTPTMAAFLLRNEVGLYQDGEHGGESAENGHQKNGHHKNGHGKDQNTDRDARVEKQKRGIVWRTHQKFNGAFERLRGRYHMDLAWALRRRASAGRSGISASPVSVSTRIGWVSDMAGCIGARPAPCNQGALAVLAPARPGAPR